MSNLPRTKRLRQNRGKRIFTDFERMAKAMFRDAAREQMVCAVCGRGGQFDAHHVLPKQELRRRHLPLYDQRNALRVHHDCHLAHEKWAVGKRIKLSALTPANIEYVNEVLGESADDWLRRNYVAD